MRFRWCCVVCEFCPSVAGRERQGKDKLHLEALRNNALTPIMFVHGKKDPVIHVEESQSLFALAANCVIELHEHGHNFGPPRHQTALLGRIAHFMRSSATKAVTAATATATAACGGSHAPVSGPPPAIGTDTYDSAVSLELRRRLAADLPVPELWSLFCTVQTAADTAFMMDALVKKLGLAQLRGRGLALFLDLRPALEAAGLNFAQKKLLADLHASMLRAHKVVARMRGVGAPNDAAAMVAAKATVAMSTSGDFNFNEVLVCGAGPVGLRAAVELAILGFHVTVLEKRPNFSRANILTFWDETMSDMLALGAKSYFPSLKPSGNQKVLGTRQIQVCLLKTLLLLGGTVHYGHEIAGLVPPERGEGKWRAFFRPYVHHRRSAETDAMAKRSGEAEGSEAPTEYGENAADAAGTAGTTGATGTAATLQATDFQRAKDYGGKEVAMFETWEVDRAFLGGQMAAAESSTVANGASGIAPVAFDAYVIAEGGWSDSTRKLGFSKAVELFKPVFGLVANLQYNADDLKERNMRSRIHFVLEPDWPLRNCPIHAEFVEYLKGETHFFALVVSKTNHHKDSTDAYLEKLTPEQRAALPDEMVAVMRRQSQQRGLVEMGVFRRSYSSGLACLASDNVDMDRLHQMVRDITSEMGLPASTQFFQSNPVQLFDFSRRARCVDPVRVLCAIGGDGGDGGDGGNGSGEPTVLAPADFLQQGAQQLAPQQLALVLPVGDALQEPVWTQGLGINRGFHTAMNQAYACLKAREANIAAAVHESCVVHEAVGQMRWGAGHSGLAGSGSGAIGVKPFKEWNTDPRSRLPIRC